MKNLHPLEAGRKAHEPKVILDDVDPGRPTGQGSVKTTEIEPPTKPRHHGIEDLEWEELLPIPHALRASLPASPTSGQMDSQALLGTPGRHDGGSLISQDRMHASDILSARDAATSSLPRFLCRQTGGGGVRIGTEEAFVSTPRRGFRAFRTPGSGIHLSVKGGMA